MNSAKSKGVVNGVRFDADAMARLCLKFCIRRLALFGSRLKGTARPDSDIDLLVEFEPGREPGLVGLSGMEIELARVFGGAKVDLRTAEDLSPRFREQVLHSARVVYAA